MLPRHALGELERGDRFEQREERPAEQTGLLAGHDGDGARVGQTLTRFDRGRRRASPLLLRGDDGGDVGPAP